MNGYQLVLRREGPFLFRQDNLADLVVSKEQVSIHSVSPCLAGLS